MASNADVFWSAWIRERPGTSRNAEVRRCRTCHEPVRKSSPAALQSSSGFGHDADCYSFDYATGLGLPDLPTPPGNALRADVFWRSFVDDLGDERALNGICRVCEGVVRYAEPLEDRDTGDASAFGHDPDCRTLTFASTLGLGGEPGVSLVNLGRADITLARSDITLATLVAS